MFKIENAAILPESSTITTLDFAKLATLVDQIPFNSALLCTIDYQAKYYTPPGGVGSGGVVVTDPTFEGEIIEEPENPSSVGYFYVLEAEQLQSLTGYTKANSLEKLVIPNSFYKFSFSDLVFIYSTTEVSTYFESPNHKLDLIVRDFAVNESTNSLFYTLTNLPFTSITGINFGGLVITNSDYTYDSVSKTLVIEALRSWRPCATLSPVVIEGVSRYSSFITKTEAFALTYVTSFDIAYIDSISYKGKNYLPIDLSFTNYSGTFIFDSLTKTALCIN